MLETNFGPVAAKNLSTQHLLRSHGGTYVEVEWIQRLEFSCEELTRRPELKPVLIAGGQFGPSMPRRNMLVSRENKVWSGRAGETTGCFGSCGLWALNPDQFREGEFDFAYITLACARPTWIMAEGLWFAV